GFSPTTGATSTPTSRRPARSCTRSARSSSAERRVSGPPSSVACDYLVGELARERNSAARGGDKGDLADALGFERVQPFAQLLRRAAHRRVLDQLGRHETLLLRLDVQAVAVMQFEVILRIIGESAVGVFLIRREHGADWRGSRFGLLHTLV